MKKIFMAILLALTTLSVSAQFEKGTSYLNASMTGLDLSYSKNTKFTLGLNATGGYFLEDGWMLYGRVGYDHPAASVNTAQLGVGGRYYIEQNGLYLNLGLQYEFAGKEQNYIHLTPELGYCFYLNHYLSIEPAVYYNCCLNKFSEASRVGLKVGLGFYF